MPLNTLVAMCTPGDVYPAPLADARYHLAGKEYRSAAGDGKVVIDAVLFRPDRNIVLAGEAKSGANVDEDQARGHGLLRSDDVIVAAAITIREAGGRWLQALYVCLGEHLDRVLQGLGEAGLACPVLAVYDDRVERHGAVFLDPDAQARFSQPLDVPGPPPRIIPVDEQSPDEALDLVVLPALVAALSHQRPQVSVPALAEQALPHLAIFGKAARRRRSCRPSLAASSASRGCRGW